MFDWGAFTLFLYILMRMSGFVLFNPVFGRNGIPALFRAGLIGLLSMTVFYAYGGSAPVPDSLFSFAFRLLMELGAGFAVGIVMRFFFFIASQAGEIVDTQMGLSMAKAYDPSTGAQETVTGNMLNTLMLLLFIAENGHITLLRLMLTSGEIVPFGTGMLGMRLADDVLQLFTECALLALKIGLPILAAELMGQVGMGVLMKVIPQINVFTINIDLKIIIGLVILLLLLSPMSEVLLEAESNMLGAVRQVVAAAGG